MALRRVVDRAGPVLLQTVIPGYRWPVIHDLQKRLEALVVVAGDRYFDESIRTQTPAGAVSPRLVRNRYLAGRRLLWQGGALKACIGATVLVAELNPRILSTWCLVMARRALRRRTALWGHYHSRGTASGAARGTARRTMLRLAGSFVAYSNADVAAATATGRHLLAVVAANAVEFGASPSARLEQRTTITYIGRLVSGKGPLLLVEAMATARTAGMDGMRLEFVGDGPIRGVVEARARDLGVPVTMHGETFDDAVIAAVFARSFVSAIPGYVGLNAIHALGYGVPIIIADEANHSPEIEACRVGVDTFTFKAGSSTDLARAIQGAWELREDWTPQWRRKLASHVRRRYSVEAVSAVLAGVLSGRARVGSGE